MRTALSLEPTRKSFILLAAGSVVGFLTCCAVAAVGYSQIKTAKADYEQKQMQLEDGRQIAARLKQSQDKYIQATNELAILEKNVSTRAYIPTMLKQLEALAKTLDLRVDGVRPIKTEPKTFVAKPGENAESVEKAPVKPPYEGQRIDISLKGNYNNALSFIYRLNRFPKVLTVNNVEITPAVAQGSGAYSSAGPTMLNVKMNITAYLLDDQEGADEKSLAINTFKNHMKELSQVGVEKMGPEKKN